MEGNALEIFSIAASIASMVLAIVAIAMAAIMIIGLLPSVGAIFSL